ncbi:hypothetical protein NP590_19910 [Methylomonas sp. SURF-2]|uniref:Uncharacterized protein n=1 Tax=Methylomonas subterranea TaxID=2952225 RepID=A0ABT1TLN4_9GAMM|nr:hypothetical protein [Methylomonas sp. SURF-2]MCQ8106379.1 hypothetical protein [Methylomonas sp. SURF-2]
MPVDHAKVLQLAASGAWDAAHQMVRAHDDTLSCWMHGYLHRLEGDLSNARYWYGRAGRDMPDNSLEQELRLLSDWINCSAR